MNPLDLSNPIDKAIQDLIDKGLVELAYSSETGEPMVGLTDKGYALMSQLKADGYEPKPADQLTKEDEKQLECFLNKVEKDLDSLC
jgi:hypothetical protein